MEEILNSLTVNEILYTTRNRINFLFIRRSRDNGIRYSINRNSKTLPLNTILRALEDNLNGISINVQWYRDFNVTEYTNSPCNLSVLINLLNRLI